MNTLFYTQNTKRNDPFAETVLPSSHYHPTTQNVLTTKEKETKIKSHLAEQSKQKKTTKESKKVSPKEKTFLDKGHAYITRELPTHDTPSPGNNSSKFEESWPSSELPSTLDSPEVTTGLAKYQPLSNQELPLDFSARPFISEQSSMNGQPSWKQSKSSNLFDGSDKKKPTIARYIDRFRYAEPRSRQERQREKTSQDFWWLHHDDSTSFQTSTPTDEDSSRGRRIPAKARPSDSSMKGSRTSGSMDAYMTPGGPYESDSSSFLAPHSTDRHTADIQHRANALIERSETTFSDESIVKCDPRNLFAPSSTQSQHPFSSLHIVPPEYNNMNRLPVEPHIQNNFKASMRKSTPEDDILYQWRLRRKLEQARERPAMWKEPISVPSSRVNIPGRTVTETRKDGVDSKLSEFRERLRHQEQVSGLRLSYPSRDQTRHTGNDPIPQTIATQTNGMSQARSELNQSPDRNSAQFSENNVQIADKHDVLPVQISSPKHKDYLHGKPGVVPHLHMSCDIIPCHDVTHHEHTKETHLKPQPQNHKLDDAETDIKDGSIDTQKETYSAIEKEQYKTSHGIERNKSVPLHQDETGMEDSVDLFDDTIVSQAETPDHHIGVPSSPITSMIGKVVGDRLFSTPKQSVSPCSSVHSLPSMHSSTQDSRNEVVNGSVSDGNSSGEFSDDELLQVLRQKREIFDEELREIDKRLAEFENT
ncbi:uncharacterized protein [Antedon mediterranea]|uniref:uncharacterized protein n=1 Tax=Antedon mediterranea TaxID=105859 RepID=UPI003AF44BFB